MLKLPEGEYDARFAAWVGVLFALLSAGVLVYLTVRLIGDPGWPEAGPPPDAADGNAATAATAHVGTFAERVGLATSTLVIGIGAVLLFAGAALGALEVRSRQRRDAEAATVAPGDTASLRRSPGSSSRPTRSAPPSCPPRRRHRPHHRDPGPAALGEPDLGWRPPAVGEHMRFATSAVTSASLVQRAALRSGHVSHDRSFRAPAAPGASCAAPGRCARRVRPAGLPRGRHGRDRRPRRGFQAGALPALPGQARAVPRGPRREQRLAHRPGPDALESTTDNRKRVRATFEAYFDFVAHESGAFRLIFESDLTNVPRRPTASPVPTRPARR